MALIPSRNLHPRALIGLRSYFDLVLKCRQRVKHDSFLNAIGAVDTSTHLIILPPKQYKVAYTTGPICLEGYNPNQFKPTKTSASDESVTGSTPDIPAPQPAVKEQQEAEAEDEDEDEAEEEEEDEQDEQRKVNTLYWEERPSPTGEVVLLPQNESEPTIDAFGRPYRFTNIVFRGGCPVAMERAEASFENCIFADSAFGVECRTSTASFRSCKFLHVTFVSYSALA